MRKSILALSLLVATTIPSAAFALEGIGLRATVTGVITSVTVTDEQKSEEWGGTVMVKADNGQDVEIELDKYTVIIFEGKSSRKPLLPADLQPGQSVRARGLRKGSAKIVPSLFVITNYSNSALLTNTGEIKAINGNTVSVLLADGKVSDYTATNETQVIINIESTGPNALTLIGKQARMTFNPQNRSQLKVITIVPTPSAKSGSPKTTIDLRRR